MRTGETHLLLAFLSAPVYTRSVALLSFHSTAMLTVGLGAWDPSREQNVNRLIVMLRDAHRQGAECVVFTECALTAFFPHWEIPLGPELDRYFEREMPNAATAPLFVEAKRLGVGFCLGYAELAEEGGATRHYNTCILVDAYGEIIGKYRKTHLPGYFVPNHEGPNVHFAYQNLEKRYFDVGDLGWNVWDAFGGRFGMCICNDRRWAETYRVMGLQGVECVMLGYNTPVLGVNGQPAEAPHLSMFQNHLSMQAGAYQNATWVCAAAKAGDEEGVYQIGMARAYTVPSSRLYSLLAEAISVCTIWDFAYAFAVVE
eukprot:COSAG02_NODE_251_length_27002_cov_13.799242_2_plen_314_part_00